MDRQTVYQGQIPLSTDLLNGEKFAMEGLARLCEALLGTSTVVSGLACTATAPASLSVNVGYGTIYEQVQADATPWGAMPADTTLLVKQGIVRSTTNFAITPPGTGGQSINYLIQATYSDTDSVPVTLLYLNPSNPPASYASPWSGPNNSGQAQNTVRAGVCVLSIKAGVPAATGTQVTPTPDANNVGIWVVTIANGQSTVTSGNITQYPGAPFITPITTVNAQ